MCVPHTTTVFELVGKFSQDAAPAPRLPVGPRFSIGWFVDESTFQQVGDPVCLCDSGQGPRFVLWAPSKCFERRDNGRGDHQSPALVSCVMSKLPSSDAVKGQTKLRLYSGCVLCQTAHQVEQTAGTYFCNRTADAEEPVQLSRCLPQHNSGAVRRFH
jgi:hypothetical protein